MAGQSVGKKGVESDAMQCAGDMEIKIPNIDRIAREGVQILNAYSVCPVSVPA